MSIHYFTVFNVVDKLVQARGTVNRIYNKCMIHGLGEVEEGC